VLEHLVDISAEELGLADCEELVAAGKGENKWCISLI